MSSETSSARASVRASESGQSVNAGRVRMAAMWIAWPVSWMSSVELAQAAVDVRREDRGLAG